MAGECCICIGNITDPGDSAASSGGLANYPVATKCGHLFHHSCLGTWLKQKSVCPSCKNPVRKNTYFRIFLDAGSGDAGTADEPVDVDGTDAVAVRRARAESRRYELLEEEVVNTRKALDIARNKADVAEQKANERQSRINEQRRVMQEQDMVHSHDKAEAANWKRKYERLHVDHVNLSDQADKWRVIHDQRAKAEKIANEDADFDPAIDRPEVLKWANKQLISTKAELKRQLLELRTENERLQKAADVAKKRLERQKEKDRERRAKEREHTGTRNEASSSRSLTHPAENDRPAAAGAVDLVAPLGDLLPPRRESSKLVPQTLSAGPASRPAAADVAETSVTFEPPASPELTNGDSGCAASEATEGSVKGATQRATNSWLQEPLVSKDEDTAWAAALLEEEGGWNPSPTHGAAAVHKPSVEVGPELGAVVESTGIMRTKTVVVNSELTNVSSNQPPQLQPQRRRPHGTAFGFVGASTAATTGGSGASAVTKAKLPTHPVNRPVPAEFLGWTTATGSKRGRQVVAVPSGGGKSSSKAATGTASKSAKRRQLLSGGRGHTPKVSSFFKP